MNRRIAYLICILVGVCYFVGTLMGVIYDHPRRETSGAKVRIEWEASKTPPCSATVKVACGYSLSIIAFAQDGTVRLIASKLPPTSTGVSTVVPEGNYSFWLVLSGIDENGAFVVSKPGTVGLSVPHEGKPTVEQPAEDDGEPQDATLDRT